MLAQNTARRYAMLAVATLALPILLASARARAEDPPHSSVAVARQLDSLLQSDSASLVDDHRFARRVFFDTIGYPPTVRDLKDFAQDESTSKRSELVNRLLERQLYGRNWAEYWTDVVMYRRSEDRALRTVPVMTDYLTDAINAGVDWSQVAASFVTATGDVAENGATGLIMAQAGKPEDTVAEVSRIFLGVQIQCAQCHDHFTDSWTREQFHELAAFFPRTALRPKRDGGKRSFVVTSVDRTPMRQRKNPDRHFGKSQHFMPDLEDPQAEGTLMSPVFFLTGEELPLAATDVERRTQLADWIVSNEWFAKSTVNRIWTEMVGSGFFNSVDDIGPERECEHDDALELLANEFVKNEYDMRWLIRTIAATAAYQAPSASRNADGNWSPAENRPARLRSDQLFNAVTQLFGNTAARDKQRRKAQRKARIVFESNFGFDPSLPQSEVKGSVPQALMLMNSKIVDRQLQVKRPGGVAVALQSMDDDPLIEYLYLRCVSREPTKRERKIALAFLTNSTDRQSGFQDIVWSLLNSSEFMFRS